MEILYSGQARTLVMDLDEKLILHRFGDNFRTAINPSDLKFVFGSADDVRAREVKSVSDATAIAIQAWQGSRAVLNLSLAMSVLSKSAPKSAFLPSGIAVAAAVSELGKQFQDEAVYRLAASTICLQFIFFPQNDNVLRGFSEAAEAAEAFKAGWGAPFARLATFASTCKRALSLAKLAAHHVFEGDVSRAASAYRYLLKSEVMSDLIVLLATDIGDAREVDPIVLPATHFNAYDDIQHHVSNPVFGIFDEAVDSAKDFLEDFVQLARPTLAASWENPADERPPIYYDFPYAAQRVAGQIPGIDRYHGHPTWRNAS